jgi:hypothetical protein
MADLNEQLGNSISSEIDSHDDVISRHGGVGILTDLVDGLSEGEINEGEERTNNQTDQNFENEQSQFENTELEYTNEFEIDAQTIQELDSLINDADLIDTIVTDIAINQEEALEELEGTIRELNELGQEETVRDPNIPEVDVTDINLNAQLNNENPTQNKEEDIFTKHEEEKEIVVDKKTTFSNETFEETSKKPETKDEDTRSTINKILNSSSDNSDKYKLTKVMTTGIGSENAEGNPNAEKLMQGMQEQREKNEKKRPLKFILVESLKYRLYKKLIAKVNTAQAKISICNNDKGRTSIYLGPFNKKSKQQQMIDMLLENDITEASTITLTKEEFDSRCNF